MKKTYDLSEIPWTLEGYTPFVWMFERRYGGMGGNSPCIDIPAIPATVPGSVQESLKKAGFLPDWTLGVNYRQCEWVENRHWIFRCSIPDHWLEPDTEIRLHCEGLDYSGWIYLNGQPVGTFKGSHIPHVCDLTKNIVSKGNVLEIIFDLPPRWLGQFGFTSQMTEWKTRFNYTWDWSPRLVQVGIWDRISLEVVHDGEISSLSCFADLDLKSQNGVLLLHGEVKGILEGSIELELKGEDLQHLGRNFSFAQFETGIHWDGLLVEAWWPNLAGKQPLYTLICRLLDREGIEHDRQIRRVGFKHVDWKTCEGAPEAADPWICVVNGRPIFLQGVNFPPVLPNFADISRIDYEKKLSIYHDMGLNCFRINACQYLEKPDFYDLCDEYGLMVWQEFPLTSSGIDNWPPEDNNSIQAVAEIATSHIRRRGHHVSLILWSGGNELQGDFEGNKSGIGKPCDLSHPMLNKLGEVAKSLDPIHRYIPTSPTGPRAGATPEEFGMGVHWDVHGGASMLPNLEAVKAYCADDDALFRSETYCPGASPAELIRKYAGNFDPWPPTTDNPYWTRLTTWWNDWKKLISIHGREPVDLEEYVSWSQELQSQLVAIEMKSCKDRFPRCGGVLHWSGHDTFPLAINSSFIDYDNHLKPVGEAVKKIWREEKS